MGKEGECSNVKEMEKRPKLHNNNLAYCLKEAYSKKECFRYLRTNRNLSVSARLSDFLVYNCSSKSLTILCYCILSFVMSSPSFKILFQPFLFLDESS